MKTIGLIGGMSWESTLLYYRLINETVREQLGGLHSAPILLHSVEFAEIEALQHSGRWDEAGVLLAQSAVTLEAAGADVLVLCTNTMHKVAPAIESAVAIPLLHIADPTGEAIREAGLKRVGLLGTRFTMEQEFYRDRLQTVHGITVVTPAAPDRDLIHHVIYEELCRGIVKERSRDAYHEVIERLVANGAQAVILGCTEIGLLVRPEGCRVRLFDTTELHARAAARWATGA